MLYKGVRQQRRLYGIKENLKLNIIRIMEVLPPQNKSQFIDFSFTEKDRYYWWASWFADVLGYSSLSSLKPSIDKAKLACMQMGISLDDNFKSTKQGRMKDIKLTKFACFLIAFQADSRKSVVRTARAFFLNELDEISTLLKNQNYLKRVSKANELSGMNKTLSSSARKAHVKDFQYFTNEGYLGMYNHTMSELKDKRSIPLNKQMSEYMGVTEITANIFRITLTKERLRLLRNPSEAKAAREHWKIGTQIRSLIKQNTGKYPEELPIYNNLKQLQRKLKKAQTELNKEIKTKVIGK